MSKDLDPAETQEWLDAFDSIRRTGGNERATYILSQLQEHATDKGIGLPQSVTTAFRNTIPTSREKKMPGDLFMERRVRSLVRWNALAMVMRANQQAEGIGGHIASFSSAATLYDIGFNYFFRGYEGNSLGDLVFFQGHSAPGMYARSFLEGRLSEAQLDGFRREVDGEGLSSYPHPWLMPDYWQFPTVSMGLGPIQAIYQAHIMRYLSARGLVERGNRKVWAFLGDGECDEPESLGAIGLASREGLDNLTFVINCNLQRLDGPVRGNGKIIQELEGTFRGAGWEVVKVIWGSYWDELLARDKSGKLIQLMGETVDGEYQNCKAKGGKYTRENFFNKYPETAALVANMSDDDIWRLNRGGHDPVKVFAAYQKAIDTKGRPTVILAKTVKGFGLGASGEAQNVAHNVKKMDVDSIKAFRDRFNIPVADEKIADLPYFKFDEDSEEMKYLRERREALGGYLPSRREQAEEQLEIPELSAFDAILKGSGDRQVSSTMTFVRVLNALLKDKKIGKRIVPIIPDEARTFGMEGLFRQVGIYANEGQKYVPQDADQVAYYREDKKGQVLQEGINELGAMASWVASGTSYSTCNATTIPFYIYYSMFGFQRVGDLAWAAGDSQARGFLLGATAGRTTLNGEGLQHQDGHSHVQANLIPNCITYDPTYGYEVAVIVQDGLRRMYGNNENIFYYLTLMNENYQHPEMPEGDDIAEQIIKGIYKLERVENDKSKLNVQLMGSGTILNEVRKAAQILCDDYNVSSDVYSVTSFNELAREGQDVARWNMLNPEAEQKVPYIGQVITKDAGPAISATDYVKNYSDQVRAFIETEYRCLGTDGFGRSDSRENLRTHFEVNASYIVVASLYELAQRGDVEKKVVAEAIKRFEINAEKLNPLYA